MWHTHGCASTRCQDVIVAAFTQLRRTAVRIIRCLIPLWTEGISTQAETTDMLHTNRSLVESGSGQANVDMVLKNANLKLSQWSAKWEHEMQKGWLIALTKRNLVNSSVNQQTANHSISPFSVSFAFIQVFF